ncbi:MAG: hypothetical protein BMS9Abin15_0470 [Gammaproteobacteria bacterium]|nr:MAG: hypothetical protein BMS9Abin15_0470 [Gammaproteobacteria bacterium]
MRWPKCANLKYQRNDDGEHKAGRDGTRDAIEWIHGYFPNVCVGLVRPAIIVDQITVLLVTQA